ncbi:MAG: pyridoxal phosphate-dependent aminotransferase [Bacteroidales bacterium]|nr:pyridoxal phosphate-dependent aminotransferase [Bacteroidales bacterium]
MYDFDEIVPRRGSDCVKWDEFPDGTLPMWVADMDFKASPAILKALQKRLDHGVFGYELIPDAYYDAVTSWFSRRHGWSFQRDSIIPTTGVIAAYSACIKALTQPGDRVILQPPVYNCFYPAVRNNRCEAALNTLVYEDGRYRMDLRGFEAIAADPRTKVFLLCNPHNPVGRVWTKDELAAVASICARHGVAVVSDEIHCEMLPPGKAYVPFATVAGDCSYAVCCSPTKAFNIAGIQIANIVAPDGGLRSKIDRAINENECCDVNVFGVTALIAAYNESEAWLDELRAYIFENERIARDFLTSRLPRVGVPPLEGTYLMWLDCRSYGLNSDQLAKHLMERSKLVLSAGSIYGDAGDGFMRLNLACPRALVLDGLDRLEKALS